MKPIFKTGTFLTADNLNLAQKASGLSGIIEGCNVVESSESFLLSIEPGLVKLDSGIIVRFDGSELIDTSGLDNGTYYVCLVEYSGYSIDYGIFKFEPNEYSHILLASVEKSGSTFKITNGVKASTVYLSQYLQLPYLRFYIPDNIVATNSGDIDGVMYFPLESINNGGASGGDFKVSFITNSALKTIRIRCVMDSPNRLGFQLIVNNSNPETLGSAEYYDVNKGKGFLLNVPSGMVSENDSCTLVISLFNQSESTAKAKLYEIILN